MRLSLMLYIMINSLCGTMVTTILASSSILMEVVWAILDESCLWWSNSKLCSFYLSGFSGYIHDSDILYVELYAIYHDLILAKNLNITELVCYSDSLFCLNHLKGPTIRFHIYATLFKMRKI